MRDAKLYPVTGLLMYECVSMIDGVAPTLLCGPGITSPAPVAPKTSYGCNRTADSKVACPYHTRDPGLKNTSLAVGIRLGSLLVGAFRAIRSSVEDGVQPAILGSACHGLVGDFQNPIPYKQYDEKTKH